MGSQIKFVIVSKQAPTTFDVEDLKSLAIEQAIKGSQVPVLVTSNDLLRTPLTEDDQRRIREMIDNDQAWIRLGDHIASLVILETKNLC